MNVSYLKIIVELLLRSCFVLREHFGELVITEATPRGDHLYPHRDLPFVRLGKILLTRGSNILPELPDGQ